MIIPLHWIYKMNYHILYVGLTHQFSKEIKQNTQIRNPRTAGSPQY